MKSRSRNNGKEPFRGGTFGDDYVGYEWRLENESWRGEALRLITVEVSYEAQGRQYTERLSTLVKPVSYQ